MTTPLVVFPDTVAVALSWLREQLAEECVSRVPNPRPARFVLVRRVGGPRRDLVTDEATVTVEAWAATEQDAHDLAQLARAALHTLAGRKHDDITVYKVGEFAGPASLPDPESDQPRYTLTMTIAARGVTPVGS